VKTVKKRFTDGSLSSFTQFGLDVKREKGGGPENTQRQLRQKEKEYDELKDQCLALRLENKSLHYIMPCQGCRHYLDGKRTGDTVEEYSCPSCIGVARPSREFPKDT